MGISCSSPGSSSRHQRNGSDSLHGCIQFRLGSPVRLTLNTGTVVIISKIVAHQHSGDAGRHRRCERLHPSSEVPGGTLDVRQCSNSGLHRERDGVGGGGVVGWGGVGWGGWVGGWVGVGGTHTILYTLMQLTFSPAEVVRSQGDNFGSRPSARSSQHPSRRLIKFAPPYPDPRAEFMDAMSVPWDNERGILYAFPPFMMVPAEGRSVTRCSDHLDYSTATNSFLVPGFSGTVPRRSHPAVEGQLLLTQDIALTDRVTD